MMVSIEPWVINVEKGPLQLVYSGFRVMVQLERELGTNNFLTSLKNLFLEDLKHLVPLTVGT